MPFDESVLSDGKAITQLLLQRQDRLETKMDALQAAQASQAAQVIHILEKMQNVQKGDDTNVTRIEINSVTGLLLSVVITVAVISIMFFIYSGGSFGG